MLYSAMKQYVGNVSHLDAECMSYSFFIYSIGHSDLGLNLHIASNMLPSYGT